MNFEKEYCRYRTLVDNYLSRFIKEEKPKTVYEPVRYVLEGGGKRIRPVLLLLSCEVVGGRRRDAIHAGAGIEILHNFTLVHDDIMDHAASRRGRATVHTKWDSNVAILVGDELLALAYRALLRTESVHIRKIAKLFTEGVVEVCEGQGFDKEFETRSGVTVDDYLLMIRKKTGKMITVATEIGAVIGSASDRQAKALRAYGQHVGRAFQLQDDLLDIIGDEREFGKVVGGDVMEGKRTFLLLEAFRRARGKDRALLRSAFRNGGVSRSGVAEVRRIYFETGVIDATRAAVRRESTRAKTRLQSLPASNARALLLWMTDMLLNRTH
ncbi:MAG TPA: polyprenyl synthetase family protein [Bacteroidetes bacterium]|nr:polyprenyl synthetase family protein [Bacteroidota bacterium]